MNLREISIDQAKELPDGSELWVGQTRQTAVRLERKRCVWGRVGDEGYARLCDIMDHQLKDLGMKVFIPTREAVPIEPAEAAARMVDGLPVECKGVDEWEPMDHRWSVKELRELEPGDEVFQIPACPEPKQRLVIEVAAGVEVPDTFEFGVIIDIPIEGRTATYSRGVTATVVSREEVE